MIRTALFTFVLSLIGPWAQAKNTKVLYLNEMRDPETFHDFAIPSTGVIRLGETLKFLIDRRNPSKPEIYYINSNYCPTTKCSSPAKETLYHYHFGKKVLKNFTISENDYYENVYNTTTLEERQYFDGRIQKFTYAVGGVEKVYYGVRFIERDRANQDIIKFTLEMVKKSLNLSDGQLAFMINGQAQKVDQIESWAKANDIPLLTMEDILSDVDYIGLNPGVAYGFVRYAPKEPDDLEPYEIPVFEELPLDLAIVAGTITTQYQDAGSHINLISKGRVPPTPNMVVRSQAGIDELRRLDGQPIKLTVTYEGYKIEPTTREQVIAEYDKIVPRRWQTPAYEPASKLLHFDDMCPKRTKDCLAKGKSYGGKVAGLGYIAHKKVVGIGSPLQKKLGYRITPLGFGVPLSAYNEFVEHNRKINPEFGATLDALIDSEMSLNGKAPLPTPQKKQLIQAVAEQFLKGEFPKETYLRIFNELEELKRRVALQYPGVELNKLKIRSSANTEDIANFNGAGLHDSYSAKIGKSSVDDFNSICRFEMELDEDTGLVEEKVKPGTVACAMKADFASLWTIRAVRERSFRRFDHRFASMGLSIQPSYKFRDDVSIVANSVLITRVMGTESVYGHQLSTQVGNGLVTNPAPNTRAELAVISFSYNVDSVGINVLQFAKPKPDEAALTTTVLPESQMLLHSDIAKAIETPYCQDTPGYYSRCETVGNSAKKKYALDMEFKTYSNGEILVKQARLYSGK